MTYSYAIDIDGIGSVLFEQSRRAKRVIIYVKSSGLVRVAVPEGNSLKKALEFVHLKNKWIKRHLAKTRHDENRDEAFRDALLSIGKEEAKRKLQDKLSHLARTFGFKYNKTSIREQKTRWGSCSRRNNISLNIKLVLLPEALCDYVILHELVHTRIHNHSKNFWAELDRHVGNSKILARQLRMDSLRLR